MRGEIHETIDLDNEIVDKKNELIDTDLIIDISQEENSPVLIEDNETSNPKIINGKDPIELVESTDNVLEEDLCQGKKTFATLTEVIPESVEKSHDKALMDWSEYNQNCIIQGDLDKNIKIHVESNKQAVTNLSEIFTDITENKENGVIDISQEDELMNLQIHDESTHLIPKAAVESCDFLATDKKIAEIVSIEKEIAECKKKITILDEEEVTDDNCSSPYLQTDKLKAKIVQLYKKLCKLNGHQPIKGRRVHLKVINGHPKGPIRRLENFLNKNIVNNEVTFPDFNDVVRCVTKANEVDGLGWNKQQIMREAALIFTHCGRELQKKRQKREWKDLLRTVKQKELKDPADEDPELLTRLQQNKLTANHNESNIFERYANIQDNITTNICFDNKKNETSISIIKTNSENNNRNVPKGASQTNTTTEAPNNQNNEINVKDSNLSNINIIIQNDIDVNKSSETIDKLALQESKGGEIYSNKMKENELGNKDRNNVLIVNSNDAASLISESLNMSCKKTETLENEPDVGVNLNVDETCLSVTNVDKDVCIKTELSKDLSKSEDNIVEINAVSIKTEKSDIDIVKMLNEFGPNFTATIVDIYDPFLIIELSSDSSDDELE